MTNSKFSNYLSYDASFFSPSLVILTEIYLPDLYRHIVKINLDHNFADVWFSRIFVSVLPFQTVLRIFDYFIVDGIKILFRVALAILSLYSPFLLTTGTTDFSAKLEEKIKELHDADTLIELALNFPLVRSHLIETLKMVRDRNLPDFTGLSNILDRDKWPTLWNWLPQRYKLDKPLRLFCTNADGFNMNTMIKKCGTESPLILVIKSSTKTIFGSFISSCTFEKSTVPSYKGSGETFLFRLSPHPKRFCWSKTNPFFCLVSQNNIQIGGGTGCGLMIDDELDKGISEMCETFNNEPLNFETDFQCVAAEVFMLEHIL